MNMHINLSTLFETLKSSERFHEMVKEVSSGRPDIQKDGVIRFRKLLAVGNQQDYQKTSMAKLVAALIIHYCYKLQRM